MVNAPPMQPKPDPFAIPPPSVASHPDVMLSVRELKRWIEDLPLANPARAGNQLLHQLRLLARDPNPGAKFANLLALYDFPVGRLLETVHERLESAADGAQPLDQLESLLVELLTELAFGHLRIANQHIAADKPVPPETLYRAMSLLDRALNIEHLRYRRLVPQRWQLILNIFLHAEHQAVADTRIDAKLRQTDEPDSIRGLFLRALVICVCDPHQMLPSEIAAWRRWIIPHTGLLVLSLLPQGSYAIPVDISGASTPLTGARTARPGTHTRYLGADGLMQRLHDDEEAPASMRQALTDLIKGRRKSEQRQTERQPRNHPYRLIYGLRNIHKRLEELTLGDDPQTSEVRAVPCRQVNQSRFGAAFQLQGPLMPPLSVGEPLLAEAAGAAGSAAPVGFAARIRRVFSGEQQQIEIGVEKIQGRLIPATIVGAAAEKTRGDTQALIQHDADTGRYTLVASRSIYRKGETVAAEGSSMRYSLRMLRLGGVVHQTAYIDAELLNL